MGREGVSTQGDSAGPGMVLVISGPSGVGKTTITTAVRQQLADAVFSVSATTRAPTANEQHGREYYFLSPEEFQDWIDRGEFLEHAQFAGNWYGTPWRPVAEQVAEGHVIMLDIDVQGGSQVKAKIPDAFSIFILPPSEEDLLLRLRKRAREGEEAIQRRFREAKREIEQARGSGAYDVFVVNDDLAGAVERVLREVREERSRRAAAQAAGG
ncbi:MAG: guanylate kinase [Planctomycetota bacterium]|nr:guanylate kinase [Planctomycetota bacterium]